MRAQRGIAINANTPEKQGGELKLPLVRMGSCAARNSRQRSEDNRAPEQSRISQKLLHLTLHKTTVHVPVRLIQIGHLLRTSVFDSQAQAYTPVKEPVVAEPCYRVDVQGDFSVHIYSKLQFGLGRDGVGFPVVRENDVRL